MKHAIEHFMAHRVTCVGRSQSTLLADPSRGPNQGTLSSGALPKRQGNSRSVQANRVGGVELLLTQANPPPPPGPVFLIRSQPPLGPAPLTPPRPSPASDISIMLHRTATVRLRCQSSCAPPFSQPIEVLRHLKMFPQGTVVRYFCYTKEPVLAVVSGPSPQGEQYRSILYNRGAPEVAHDCAGSFTLSLFSMFSSRGSQKTDETLQCIKNSVYFHHAPHCISIYSCQRVCKSLWQPTASK